MPTDRTAGYAQSRHVMQAASRNEHVEVEPPVPRRKRQGLKLREGLLTTQFGRFSMPSARSVKGHERWFPPPRPNGRCGFREGTFAGATGNDEGAPITAVRRAIMEPFRHPAPLRTELSVATTRRPLARTHGNSAGASTKRLLRELHAAPSVGDAARVAARRGEYELCVQPTAAALNITKVPPAVNPGALDQVPKGGGRAYGLHRPTLAQIPIRQMDQNGVW